MVERNETIWKYRNGILHRAEFGEVEISQNDTVIFASFTNAEDLYNVVFWKKTNGAIMTSTISNNVATITGAGVNIQCVYMAYGVKA